MGGEGEMGIDGSRRRDWHSDHDDGPAAPPATKPPTDAALRAASYANLDAWILHGRNYDADGTDANPGPRDGVARAPVAFLRKPGEVEEISPKDVQQGAFGDCALHATLMGLASTPEGRARIKDAVQARTDDAGRVTGYSVKLYETQAHLFGRDTFREKRVELPADGLYARAHAMARGDATHDELWPLLVEKAYAQLRGSYTRIGNGLDPRRVLETLTGRPAWHMDPAKVNDVMLSTALAAHHVVVLSTRSDLKNTEGVAGTEDNPYGLVPLHAYAVVGVQGHGGDAVVILSNPWGRDDPKPVPVRELSRWATDVSGGCP